MTAIARIPVPRLAAAACAATFVAAAIGGCGGSDNDKSSADTSGASSGATGDGQTKVEVIKALPANDGKPGSFDPATIYQRDSRGVVTIIATGLSAAGLGQGGQGNNAAGLGSGFVVSKDGEILTNAHVVTSGEGGSITEARRVYVNFPDGNRVSATVKGYDPFADVALIKVNPRGLTLRPLPLGTLGSVEVGSPVAAIGSPFGKDQSLSVGVVSAKDRSIQSLTGFETVGAIQTDAAINHGNSGGPLLDARGRVLGINSQIESDSGDGTGVGFAVPIDVVKRSFEQLRAKGKVSYSYLGVASAALYPQVAEHFKLPTKTGVWVQTVSPGGPADAAGMRADGPVERFQEQGWRTNGDIIVGVGNAKVTDDDDLARALLPYDPGQKVDVKLYRDGKLKTVAVKLGTRPRNSPQPG